MERQNVKKDFLSVILEIYVLMIGIGLPLIVRDGYFDILVIKYFYFCGCTITLMVLMIGYSLTAGKKRLMMYLKKISFEKLINSMNLADYAVIAYLIVAIISTITSDYLYESFWGNEGRFTGLFLITLYIIAYFCVSRFWDFKDSHINLILGTGAIVSLFGITDYFQMDVFHFKSQMIAEQIPIFTSTIGNINSYTAYIAIVLAIATVLYAKSKDKKHTIFYYICMFLGFLAIIMGVSDNAYLSLGALFGLLPFYLFGTKNGVKKYLIILATFFLVIQLIHWINITYANTVLGIDSAFNMIVNLSFLPVILIVLWGGIITWNFIDKKGIKADRNYGNLLKYLWSVMLIILGVAFLYILYDCNIAENAERYGSLSNYVLFNDDWGTHRGYIWRNAVECYKEFPIWKKLVGSGPETFGILISSKTKFNPYNQLFDSAHNEYLQILLTLGITGLISFLLFILASIKKCFSYKNSLYVEAIAFGIICYSVQAFVNLNVPIVASVFWLLLGMCMAKSVEKNL